MKKIFTISILFCLVFLSNIFGNDRLKFGFYGNSSVFHNNNYILKGFGFDVGTIINYNLNSKWFLTSTQGISYKFTEINPKDNNNIYYFEENDILVAKKVIYNQVKKELYQVPIDLDLNYTIYQKSIKIFLSAKTSYLFTIENNYDYNYNLKLHDINDNEKKHINRWKGEPKFTVLDFYLGLGIGSGILIPLENKNDLLVRFSFQNEGNNYNLYNFSLGYLF